MEDNKFYTPTLEELHIGFICESQFKTINQTWKIKVCDSDLLTIAYNEFEHAEEDEPFSEQFRVKYLDKEDIESCGFEIAFASDYLIEAYTDELILIYSSNDALSIRYKDYNLATDWNELIENNSKCIVFMGKVRNISELKVILHQIERG